MRTQVSFDVSGLAWRYRTGVQNLFWAYANAWRQQPALADRFDLRFHDRSGAYNFQMAETVGAAYQSCAPRWWPLQLRRPLQALVRLTPLLAPQLGGAINHVWNWGIYHPPRSRASITIPDVLPLEHPEWFDKRFRRLTQQSLGFAARDAEFVFAISENVRERITATTDIKAERIRVVYPGIDAAYFASPPDAVVQRTLQKHGLAAGRYLLSSGFLDPRKNLARQLQAFEVALSHGATDMKYALTGLKTAVSADILRIIDTPAMRSRVVFLGYVPQAELMALMSQCAAMMYCSLAEGFGLPIIEAMAMGAPVITSATTSMQELAESRGQLVDPESVDNIALAIEASLDAQPGLRQKRIVENREYAQSFTIAKWLQGHLDAYAPPSVGAQG